MIHRNARCFMAVKMAIICCFLSTSSWAEQKMQLGMWSVHYNAVNATDLSPDALKTYGIKRNRNTTVINIAPQDKDGKAFSAKVTGQAKNMLGKVKPLTFQEVKEGEAIYYLATYHHRNQEQVTFVIEVADNNQSHRFEFSKKLYT